MWSYIIYFLYYELSSLLAAEHLLRSIFLKTYIADTALSARVTVTQDTSPSFKKLVILKTPTLRSIT